MKTTQLLKKNLVYFWKNHLGTVIGAALSTAILVGALIVGDSVTYSLDQIVLNRLGNTKYAIKLQERYFRTQLADELSKELDVPVTAVLQTKGIAVVDGGEKRVSRIQVNGVHPSFNQLSNHDISFNDLGSNDAFINEFTANQLDLAVGEEFLLRMETVDAMPKDTPLASDADLSTAKRYTVKKIVTEKQFGRFSLENDQSQPLNVFVNRDDLARDMNAEQRANVLLIADNAAADLSAESVQNALKKCWSINDAGLQLTDVSDNTAELSSSRIFMDSFIWDSVNNLFPNAQPVLTYFVNEITRNNLYTPYSFVSAAPSVSSNLADDEIVINQWLANDIHAKVGDSITLKYYTLGSMRQLVEQSSTFKVKSIVPMRGSFIDQSLMPEFPGLADADNCSDWDPGMPVNFDKIRDKDEQYWDDYRGAPKAFVSLKAAQNMWGNRFGDLTAIHFPTNDSDQIAQQLNTKFIPEQFGFVVQPVLQQGLHASANATDFGELFFSLSFFIILSAALLTGLLFGFSIEHRTREIGLLRAVGFTKQATRRYLFAEGAILAFIGSLAGTVLGIGYTVFVLFGLKTFWNGAVGTITLALYINPVTVIVGLISSFIIALLTIWIVTNRLLKRSAHALQRNQVTVKQKAGWVSLLIAVTSFVVGLAIIFLIGMQGGNKASGAYFASGFLMLLAGIAGLDVALLYMQKLKSKFTLASAGLKNSTRRRSQSLTLVGLLAAGLFIIFTVGANRKSAITNADNPKSGTGAYELWAETDLPVLYDLNSKKGRDFYNLNDAVFDSAHIVHFLYRPGTEASCLNLNAVTQPKILGVDGHEFDQRGSFTFATFPDNQPAEHPWLLLDQPDSNRVVPGLADQTVIQWSLLKTVGDTLDYVDEFGRPFKIRLVAGLASSVFQGHILISKEHLLKYYPSTSGSRAFLVEADSKNVQDISNKLNWGLQDNGLQLTTTVDRLNGFSLITNTYLAIFLMLGSFGLLIGTVGFAIVLIRHLNERTNELGLLKAVGFEPAVIKQYIFIEYGYLFVVAILIGFVSALIAVLPALLAPGGAVPYATLVILIALLTLSGYIAIYLATRFALKADVLSALRTE